MQWPFFKNLNQRSLTPIWPLTQVCWDHVWVYPRIIVSKSHENISKYLDTVTLFQKKTWIKGHWTLDDLWSHVYWGHMCDATQGPLCSGPMGIYQYMWMQWSILPNTTYYIYTSYYIQTVHTTFSMSNHVVSFWKQFRRDKHAMTPCPFSRLDIYFCSVIYKHDACSLNYTADQKSKSPETSFSY